MAEQNSIRAVCDVLFVKKVYGYQFAREYFNKSAGHDYDLKALEKEITDRYLALTPAEQSLYSWLNNEILDDHELSAQLFDRMEHESLWKVAAWLKQERPSINPQIISSLRGLTKHFKPVPAPAFSIE